MRGLVVGVAVLGIGACAAGKGDGTKSASEALAAAPATVTRDAGPRPTCEPATCSSLKLRCGQADDGCGGQVDCGACASSRCGPDELSCCGACVPKSEGRCPENVHCPAPAPLL
ncbi:hypothetical protein DRW03_17475 [Corallococcus sp. H22C18031201]|nr:hypothetical protein DRW03_17475 [Corallococcus sp. H22C18031201]